MVTNRTYSRSFGMALVIYRQENVIFTVTKRVGIQTTVHSNGGANFYHTLTRGPPALPA